MTGPSISIIGAGISGLVLGRILLRHGVRTVLYEKSRTSRNRNRYGITLKASSYRPLLSLLAVDEKTFLNKVSVDTLLHNTGTSSTTDEVSSFRANRSRFESFLSEGLDIKYEHQFETLDSDSGLTLEFINGARHMADTIVGADGIHSRVRQFVAPETELKILPFAVFNGKRRMSREDFDSKLKKHFIDRSILETRINSTMFQISIDDHNQEEVYISYNYSRPARKVQTEATTIPKAFFDEIKEQKLDEPYRTIFDSRAMGKDRILNWLMRTLQVERNLLDRAADSGIVLTGEAVHGEPILGGYGANEAIEDGMRLAEILAGDQKLSQFYDTRYQDWMAGIEASQQRMERMHSNSKASL